MSANLDIQAVPRFHGGQMMTIFIDGHKVEGWEGPAEHASIIVEFLKRGADGVVMGMVKNYQRRENG